MREKKHLTYSILLLMLGYSFTTNLANTLLSELVGFFGLIGEAQGSIGTANSLGAVAAILCLLVLQGRFKKLTLLVFGGLLLAGTLLICGFSSIFGVFLASYAIEGLGVGIMEVCLSAEILDLQGENSAPYMGALHACFGIGGIVSPLLIRAIANASSWRNAYYIVAALIGIISLQLLFAFLRGKKRKVFEGESIAAEKRVTKQDLKAYFGDSTNRWMILAQFIAMGAQITFTYYLVYYVSDILGRPDLGSISLTVFWVSSTLVRFVYPHLPVRPLKLQGICSLIAALTIACGVIVQNGVVMLICCAVLGIVTGPGAPIIFNEGGKRMPNLSTLPVCVLSLSSYLAMTVGAPAIGKIAELSSMHVGLLLLAAMFLIGCFVGLLLNRRTAQICEKTPSEL